MWKYTNTDELYHYGILGMRWGVRRSRRIAYLENQQKKMLSNKKQLGTKKYIKISNELYLAKKREQLKKAKKNNDSVSKLTIKENISEAKAGKKYGANVINGNMFKNIYKVNRTSKEGRAISIVSNTSTNNKNRAKRVLRTIGSLSLTALATAPVWYPTLKNNVNFFKNVNPKTMRYNWKTATISGIRK